MKLQLAQARKEARLGPRPEPKPDVDGEVTRLQSLLDERTAAAAVLMQTIETLQQGAGVANVGEESFVSDGDESVDATDISRSATFAHHTLAKRVVALTSELSSANAVAAMMERRAEQLSLEVGQRNELVTYLEDRVKLLEEEVRELVASSLATPPPLLTHLSLVAEREARLPGLGRQRGALEDDGQLQQGGREDRGRECLSQEGAA